MTKIPSKKTQLSRFERGCRSAFFVCKAGSRKLVLAVFSGMQRYRQKASQVPCHHVSRTPRSHSILGSSRVGCTDSADEHAAITSHPQEAWLQQNVLSACRTHHAYPVSQYAGVKGVPPWLADSARGLGSVYSSGPDAAWTVPLTISYVVDSLNKVYCCLV